MLTKPPLNVLSVEAATSQRAPASISLKLTHSSVFLKQKKIHVDRETNNEGHIHRTTSSERLTRRGRGGSDERVWRLQFAKNRAN